MKLRKKILLVLVLSIFMVFGSLNQTKAAVLVRNVKYGLTTDRTSKWTVWIPDCVNTMLYGWPDCYAEYYFDGVRGYCMQALVDSIPGNGDYVTKGLSQYFRERGFSEEKARNDTEYLSQIMGLGWNYNGSTSDEWYWATQIRLWQALQEIGAPGNTTQGIFEIHPEIQALIDELNSRLEVYRKDVSFNNTSITLTGFGKEHGVTLSDSNGVFTNYVPSTTNAGIHCEKNGNTVFIYAEKGDAVDSSLTFEWNVGHYNGEAVAHFGEPVAYDTYPSNNSSQNIVIGGVVSKKAKVNVAIRTGSVQINKVDIKTGKVPQGDAKLVGAKYSLTSDKTGKRVGILTIGDDLNSNIIENLPIDTTYTISEIYAPEGYLLSNDSIKVEWANPNGINIWTGEVKDKVITNSIEIIKYIGETLSSAKSPLAGAEFTATLDSDPTKVYKAITDENGYCIIENLPYGHYTIEETKVPANTLKCSNFKVFIKDDSSVVPCYDLNNVTFVDPDNRLDNVVKHWLDENGNLVDEPKVMKIRIRKVDKDGWEGKEKVDFTQGDAVLKGAIYEVYEWQSSTNSYSKFIENITVNKKDSEGYWYAESSDLLVGKKYMVKEKVKYEETVDGKTYKYSFAEGYLVDETEFEFYQEPETQTTKRTYKTEVSKEEVVRGRISVIKYDNQDLSSDESPAKGAILRLTLDKDPNVYYEARIDEKGFAEFIDRNDADGSHVASVKTCYGAKYYPYTLPCGEYTITEIKASDKNEHTSYYIKPVSRVIDGQADDVYNTILADEPIKMRLKIVKKDTDTNRIITNNSAEFKIYDCQNNKMLEFVTMSGVTESLHTNEEGWFYTPQELLPGKYVLYEVDSPNAYYLDPKLKLPENANDLGNTKKAGMEIDLNKIIEAEVTDKNNPKEYVHTIEVKNAPLKGKVEVVKTGEMLTGYKTEKVTGLNGETYTVTKPVYEYKPLEGVEYTLTAKEDIKSPDGVTWEAKGTKHKIETNSEGYAISEELYCGTYTVEETKTPLGFKTDKNIPDIVVTNTDKNERIKTISKEYKNQKMPTQIDVEKVLAEDEFDLSEDKVGVILGIYADGDIKNYNQTQTVIKKGTLLDVVEGKIQAGDRMTLTSNVNLPEGKYYVKELYVDYPYTVDVNDKGFEVKFDTTKVDKVLVKGIVINNNIPVSASIGFIKLSTSFFKGDESSKIGGYLSDEELAHEQSLLSEWVNNTPFDTVMAVLRGEEEAKNLDISRYRIDSRYKLSGATYEIYKDKELTKPLTKDGKVVSFTTDERGVGKVERLPLGVYYLKETQAPKLVYNGEEFEYDKELGEIKIELSHNDENKSVARLLSDHTNKNLNLTKTDMFTGELIPNCRFEIRDSKGELIVDATTDDEGKFIMPIDLFKEKEEYTYTEKEAPEMYDIDTTPHKFKLELDEYGKPIPVGIENIRKSKELRILKVDEETGEPLQGCVFSIVALDENGEQKIGKDGLPLYLVKDAITDENGEYIIEKAYYGTYKFIEVKAPKDHELTEKDMEGYVFTIDENSADRIDFVITNTGDIAVIAIAVIAVVCVIGIAFVIVRNKKNSK